METVQIEDGVRQIRMSLEELEKALEAAEVIDGGEAINRAWVEPGELVLRVVQ